MAICSQRSDGTSDELSRGQKIIAVSELNGSGRYGSSQVQVGALNGCYSLALILTGYEYTSTTNREESVPAFLFPFPILASLPLDDSPHQLKRIDCTRTHSVHELGTVKVIIESDHALQRILLVILDDTSVVSGRQLEHSLERTHDSSMGLQVLVLAIGHTHDNLIATQLWTWLISDTIME
jgi:hypothetical protein